MSTFLVTWDIHVEADTPEDAARQAQAIQRNPQSTATVFLVQAVDYEHQPLGRPAVIDLGSDHA